MNEIENAIELLSSWAMISPADGDCTTIVAFDADADTVEEALRLAVKALELMEDTI